MPTPLPAGCEVRCRACSHRELTEVESLSQKSRFLTQLFFSEANSPVPIESPGARSRLGYRRKALLSVQDRKIGLMMKARARDQADEVLEIPRCPVHAEEVNRVAQIFREHWPKDSSLRYLCQMGDLVSVVLKEKATEQRIFELKEWVRSSGLTKNPDFGFFANFNPSSGDRVFATKGWHHLGGAQQGSFRLLDQVFFHGPSGFMQVQPSLYEKALLQVRDFFTEAPVDGVIDLYCGLGVSLNLWRKHFQNTIGVELSEESIQFAMKNDAGPILRGKCGERLPQLGEFLQGVGRAHLFCNPPRLGLEDEVLEWILAHRASLPKIAYLSCSPGTLARDLEKLKRGGYRMRSLSAYDFFPQTQHVETLILLESF